MKLFSTLTSRLLSSLLIALVSSHSAFAQGSDEKRALAERIVKAQQGSEVERMASGLAQRSAGRVAQDAATVLERQVPQANREAAGKQMNDALEAYIKDAAGIIKAKTPAALSQTVVPLYMEKFSLEELKQMATFFESDVSKKYQQVTPELGQAMMQGIIKETEGQINPKLSGLSKKLEDILVKNGAKKADKPATGSKPSAPGAPGTSPKNPLKPPATTPEGVPVPRPDAQK
jgi:uncharacterized protein